MSTMADSKSASRLRQALVRAEQERERHVRDLLGERGPVIRGSFVRQPGRCGKPSCKCARGEFHSTAAFYTRIGGKQRCFYVPLEDRERIERLSCRQQKMRAARLALAKLGAHSVELAGQLEDALIEAYPPAERVARNPASGRRRGRKGNAS
jgi:hypothetical protein